MPGFHCGRPPRNKGRSYPADPPTVEEIVAVMRRAGDRTPGLRTRALIVLLWGAGLRINEALLLTESDLDAWKAVAHPSPAMLANGLGASAVAAGARSRQSLLAGEPSWPMAMMSIDVSVRCSV